jgi:hypothetical protein
MSPTISCIILVYNAAEYLTKRLDSVLTQSRKLDAIIVATDRPTYHTKWRPDYRIMCDSCVRTTRDGLRLATMACV